MKKLALFFVTIFMAVACNTTLATKAKDGEAGKPGKSARTAVAYTIVAEYEYGGAEEQSYVALRNDNELNEYAMKLGLETIPEIDFSDKMAVLIFLGQKNTGGYKIGLEYAEIIDETLQIKIQEIAPSGMVTTALTNPYCIIEVPKAESVEVKF